MYSYEKDAWGKDLLLCGIDEDVYKRQAFGTGVKNVVYRGYKKRALQEPDNIRMLRRSRISGNAALFKQVHDLSLIHIFFHEFCLHICMPKQ